MGSVEKLATEVRHGLEEAHPEIRKTLLKKLPLAVAAIIEARTPNTVEVATLLPPEVERLDLREQWLRRLLKNPLIDSMEVMEPFGRQVLREAASKGQTVLLSMDQTDLGSGLRFWW
jgi:hypothetical protein